MDIGVRELKQHLSDYLDRAERGQIITITERGRPKVLLVPLPGGGDRLADGIEQGWIRAAAKPGALAPARRAPARALIGDVLDHDRGD
ncbi:MAG TPA: type II toxin-antitoxin system prevent-host-death family antitoxin [Ilumatobacteraceae bacterium]|jgi:prevent-host-death family protein|nr:type II toxin-antitoxin system prevent-host-death family antitoxin [Ilumatobacteraceae bacterium]